MESSTLILLSIPFFVVSMLLEAWAGRHDWRVLYTRRDTQASLTMGIGNVLINAAIGALVLGATALQTRRVRSVLDAAAYADQAQSSSRRASVA